MSLTRNDIQILKEVFQPQFDKIDQRFDQIDKRFEELEANLVRQFIAEIHELYTPRTEFNNLEDRVTVVEKELHKLPS